MYLLFNNYIICYLTFFIIYQLATAFVGVSLPKKRIFLPVLFFSVIGYISKICLGASASVQTALVVIICAGLLYLFNQIPLLLGLIGSLLAIITLTLGSMLLACPIFVQLGYTIPIPIKLGVAWLLLTLLELVVPTFVLIILKMSKFSLIKYISSIR